jgi:hypothetical protein
MTTWCDDVPLEVTEGRYKQAEEMHRQALRLYETVLDKEHPSTLTSMNNPALVLRASWTVQRKKRINITVFAE